MRNYKFKKRKKLMSEKNNMFIRQKIFNYEDLENGKFDKILKLPKSSRI